MNCSVAVLIFDGVEPLDFCGPYEVFASVGKVVQGNKLELTTVSQSTSPIRCTGGLSINPDTTYGSSSDFDVLVVPGGKGVRDLLFDDRTLEFVEGSLTSCKTILSVCTGALLLAKAGLLVNKQATTHHSAFSELESICSDTEIVQNKRFVDSGKIITAAGISAGIDASLHVVSKLWSTEIAQSVAEHMEYTTLQKS